jgi:glycosyltransferase involved in cell wall biosynthesis
MGRAERFKPFQCNTRKGGEGVCHEISITEPLKVNVAPAGPASSSWLTGLTSGRHLSWRPDESAGGRSSPGLRPERPGNGIEPMRVLLYCDDPGCGGTSVNASLLAAGLAQQGFDATLAIGGPERPDARLFRSRCVPIGYDTLRNFPKTAYSRNEPEALFLSQRPDLVLFCDGGPDSSLAAKAVCRDWNIPYVVLVNYVASSHAASVAGRRPAVVQAYAAALAVVAVCEENLALLRRDFAVAADRSGVIRYGRPQSFFTPVRDGEREMRRRSLGLSPEDVLCLTVARYEPRKGYRHLLAAAAALAGEPVGSRLAYAWIGHDLGDGGVLLAQAVRERGLASRTAVLGQRDDVREWMAAADVFVLPSESEGMPLSITEAMGQGLPVVATAVSGIPEQLGRAGILLPDPGRDPDGAVFALIRSLRRLAADPAGRRALGQAGRQRALAHFTADVMLAQWGRLLRSLEPVVAACPPRLPHSGAYLPPHRIRLGQDIPLGDDQASAEYLKEGWSYGEGGGRWTDGDRARLVLALPAACADGFVIDFDAKPLLDAMGRSARFRVRLNGRDCGLLQWPEPQCETRFAFAVLAGARHASGTAEIVFDIAGATSPASLGGSDDARRLGLWVSRLRVSPLAARARGRPETAPAVFA